MARIPDHEIERLKLQVSIVRLVEAAGVVLRPHGKERIGRCPMHEDRTPSLTVSAKLNQWNCLGACRAGGSVFDWVMRLEGLSFRQAFDRLRQEIGEAPWLDELASVDCAERSDEAPSVPFLAAAVEAGSDVPARLRPALPLPALDSASDQALLRSVVEYYHATLKASPEALAYADGRGITMEAMKYFQIGYGNRTLGTQLPLKAVKAGAEVRGALQRVGLLRESGHEHFNGSLVVPVITPDGEITEMYGRKVTPGLRPGTPLHLYLPGPHRGVFNEQGLVGHEEAIVCEALIDALTYWCAGYRNATASYGIGGFTDEMLAAFLRIGIKRALIAYDADEAGNRAAEKLAERLLASGIECYRCRFPKGMDANEYALAVNPPIKSLGVVIRQAEWMGKARTDVLRPTSRSVLEVLPGDVGDVPQRAAALMVERGDAAAAAADESQPVSQGEDSAAEQAQLSESAANVPFLAAASAASAPAIAAKKEISTTPAAAAVAPPASRVAPTVPLLPVTIDASGMLTLVLGDREYRVRGIEKNLGYEQLNVWLRASRGDYLHLDTTNLANAARRASWVKAASVELGLAEDVARADLAKLLRAVEDRQAALIREQLQPKKATVVEPSPEQQAAALALLKDPQLIERIVADVEAIGVVGEASNALVAYLACVSRKLDKPLAILIQSTSAAGKSTLMDAVLSLMPEAERVQYSAMTGQSLFYLGENDLKHKILAIAEEEGVRQAAYALKLLQSQGVLTIASTGKDPVSGQLVTQPYRVEGPVMLFLTTTSTDVDEELLNRCLVLTIDESREQTAAILIKQRSGRTLGGLLAKANGEVLLATHRAAQTLLKPLAVVNPFAEQLTFSSDRLRLRRDHQKYLTLIEAIALLHQHQRPLRTASFQGKPIEYVEVTLEDIALANRLAHDALGRSLDELPPQTRRVLGDIVTLVEALCQTHALERGLVRFTRRDLRDATHWGDTQLKLHLSRLEDHEYLITYRRGTRFEYELIFDGRIDGSAPHLIGLIDVAALAQGAGTTVDRSGQSADRSGQSADRSGAGRAAVGARSGTGRGEEIAPKPRPDADLPASVAVGAESTALTEPPPAHRSNGASYSDAGS